MKTAINRVLRIPIAIRDERISFQRVITVDLHDVPISDWCLNLCLLRDHLIDTLTCVGKKTLKIDLDQTQDRSFRAKVQAGPNLHITVQLNELNYWLSFFLKYYRDGVAEVDHIDVEALVVTEEPEEIYITFRVKDAIPPMSAEDARKILDKYD